MTRPPATYRTNLLNKVDESGVESLTGAERERFLEMCQRMGLVDTDTIREQLEREQKIGEAFDEMVEPGEEIEDFGDRWISNLLKKAEKRVDADDEK